MVRGCVLGHGRELGESARASIRIVLENYAARKPIQLGLEVLVEQVPVDSQCSARAFGGGDDGELNIPGNIAGDIHARYAALTVTVAGKAPLFVISTTETFQKR